ncbi:MAG: DUF4179 domain-containing protein [Peptostreptococcaceae bacterium]
MSKLDNIKMPDNFDEAINYSIDKALKDRKKASVYKKKKMIAGVSGAIIIGGLVLSGETTLAYIQKISNEIEKHFGRSDSEFDKYKSEGGLVSEENGLKFSINEIMLDDRKLIFSMDVESSSIKWLLKDKYQLGPIFPTVTIGDYVFTGQANGFEVVEVSGTNKSKIMMFTILHSIDTDGDGIGDKEIELLESIDPNKDYDLKIEFNELQTGDKGKWKFNTKINVAELIKSTKSYKFNKIFEVDENEYKGEVEIEEVRVSPVSVKVKYNYDLYDEISVERRREPRIIAVDENGNELEVGPGEGGELIKRRWNIVSEFILKGNERKITIIPRGYINNQFKIYEEGIVEIDLQE